MAGFEPALAVSVREDSSGRPGVAAVESIQRVPTTPHQSKWSPGEPPGRREGNRRLQPGQQLGLQKGFEPSAYRLRGGCSTVELHGGAKVRRRFRPLMAAPPPSEPRKLRAGRLARRRKARVVASSAAKEKAGVIAPALDAASR